MCARKHLPIGQQAVAAFADEILDPDVLAAGGVSCGGAACAAICRESVSDRQIDCADGIAACWRTDTGNEDRTQRPCRIKNWQLS